MSKLSLLAMTTVVACATIASAEPNRSYFTRENKFPELGQFELGATVDSKEFDAGKIGEAAAYGRYGLIENLTANVRVPYRDIDPDFGDGDSGLGDVSLGLELLAYQDIFDYPYVIPHVDVSLETGDDETGLGAGETITTVGISAGTKTYEVLHWILDVSYLINGTNISEDEDSDDLLKVSLALIWDVSDRFAWHLEGQVTDEDVEGSDQPAAFVGGFTYDWTESFVTSFYAGAGSDEGSTPDAIAGAKASYTF